MATIRLTPSTYYLSNSSYLSVSNASNMYDNTDSSTYATVTNSRTSTSSYYIYLRGFNFSDIPDNVIINSFTIKVKCNYSNGYSQAMYLYDGTSTRMGGSVNNIGSTVYTHSFDTSYSLEDIIAAGSDFGIRINCRRSNRNATSYIYIYGAEIEIDYTIPVSATVTSTLSGNGTISPSGAYSTYEGAEYELTITPSDVSEPVTATKNGIDITSSLVAHKSTTLDDRVLGTYTFKSGGFNSGESYFSGIVGNGVDASKTTSNYYSSNAGTRAVFTYDMSFDLPSGTTITRVYCEVNGHAESTSQSSEYMCVQLKSGDTELSEEINFKNVGTSNTTITLEAETLPTISQLASMVLECTLGYYGGAINGATCYVEYETGSEVTHYTYTYIVDGDATIAVVIGGSGPTQKIYFKDGSTWREATAVYKKINGVWVQQSDLSNVFQSGVKYRRG